MKQSSPPGELFPSENVPKPSKKANTSKAEEIYLAYPRKKKRPDAIRAILKAMESHDPEMLLSKTKEYATAITWQEKRFIPYPATWFNGEEFNDDPAEWKQPNGNGTCSKSPQTPPPPSPDSKRKGPEITLKRK